MLRPNADHDFLPGDRRRTEPIAVRRQPGAPDQNRGRISRQQPAAQEIHRRRADEAGDEQRGRLFVQVIRRGVLLDAAGAHDRDARRQGHRLDLVVRDIDDGGAEFLVQALESPRASRCAAWHPGWTAARRTGTPWPAAPERGRSRRADAGRRKAATACGRATRRSAAASAAQSTGAATSCRGSRRTRRPNDMFLRTDIVGYSA